MAQETEVACEKRIKNAKGVELYARYWNEDAKEIKGLVFISHGLAEHCLYYNELADHLVSGGFYVFAHDHVGHGQSEGTRAHIGDFDEYVEDIFYHVDSVKQKYPGKPIFLIGHSMGGALVILCAQKRPDFFQGVILIGPLIIPDRKTATPTKIFFGKILARIMPQAIIGQLDPKKTSRDPEFVKKYESDPLVWHGGVKCGWGLAMITACQKIERSLSEIRWPFLILHGTHDELCELEGAKIMQQKAQSKDKTLKEYEGAYHNLLSELPDTKADTLATILDWMTARL